MITAIILTFNEATHIARCIDRVKPLADRIVIADSHSTDDTVAIAAAAGAEILTHAFVNHAAQFQWAVDTLGPLEGWIVRVDADEWFEPAAIADLRAHMTSAAPDVSAFELRRKVIFRGRWIRWGGYYRTVLTRAWRVGAAHVEQRWMDEHVVVHSGRTERIVAGDLVDENLKDITDWTAKHNGYTTRQMVEFIDLEHPLIADRGGDRARLNESAGAKRYLRNRVYARAPLYLRALLYFLQRYVLRLGFLDGRQGLVFHTLQGFWNFFLIDAKVDEARSFIRESGIAAFRQHLAARHGIDLTAPDA